METRTFYVEAPDPAPVPRLVPHDTALASPVAPGALVPVDRPTHVKHKGHVIARSTRVLRHDFPDGGSIYFFPREDVRMERLGPSPTLGLFDPCGVGIFYDVVVPGAITTDAAVSFALPQPALSEIKDWIGFESARHDGCSITIG